MHSRLPPVQPKLSPEVLQNLAQQAERREPIVIKKAFPPTFMTEQDTFDSWQTFAKGIPPSRWGNIARLYRGGELVADPEPFLPTASDTSWSSYLERLGDQTGTSEWGLFLTDPQLSNATLFKRLLVFLSSLYEVRGMPSGGCIPDLFMMNHKASFFRLHKDAQDVYTIVIKGYRRFLLWPFETFSEIAGMKASEARKTRVLAEVDPEDYRSQARVVEGVAGDLLYWPSEWWHVGESDGNHAITLAVGAVPEFKPLSTLAAAANRIAERRGERPDPLAWSLSEGAEPTITASIDRMNSLLEDEELWAETRRHLLSWGSRCGLNRIPPALRRRAPLDEAQWIAVVSPSAIAFEKDAGTSLFCSIAGHDLTLTPSEPAKALLSLLSRGGAYQVGAVIDEALESCPSTRDREPLLRILEKVEENHGLERLDGPPKTTGSRSTH